jgi:hypothetical protein
MNHTVGKEFLLRFLSDDDESPWSANLGSRGSPVPFYEIKGLEEHLVNEIVIYTVVNSVMHLKLPGGGSGMVYRAQRSRGVDWKPDGIWHEAGRWVCPT